MDISIDPLSTVPLYQQIRDRIVEAIGRGELRQGEALASVRQLAGAFSINPATVKKAYDLLKKEGLIATNAKSGSYVCVDRNQSEPSKEFVHDFQARLTTLIAEGRAHGMTEHQLATATEGIVANLNPEKVQK